MLKDNIFMYYFLKVKEQFISLHLIYIKHFMANNYLLNYWINEVHWGYNYLLVVILLLVISILLYRIRKLQKTIKRPIIPTVSPLIFSIIFLSPSL